MAIKCVWEGIWRNKAACSYVARVRVRVRAGSVEICREGCGSGHGTGLTPGEANENAIKKAETDAMKRALTTFGNPFGLALYDKEQHNVRGKQRQSQNGKDQAMTWLVLSPEGEYMSAHEDPVDYCKAVRQLLEAVSTRERHRASWQRNLVTISMLRRNLPHLKTDKGEHYADILTTLYKQEMRLIWEKAKDYQQRAAELEAQRSQAAKEGAAGSNAGGLKEEQQIPNRPEGSAQQPTPTANTGNGHVDKTNLPISKPRRIRDKQHLRYVASQPCIICGRYPAQAHHLRFAQPSALGRKVSDEWTVPLCATHHRSLHSVGDEERWWQEKGIDASAHAVQLWWKTRQPRPEWARTDKTTISSNRALSRE